MGKGTKAFYNVLADVFEPLVAGDHCEVTFVLEQVSQSVGRALDVGVGTGRFGVALAQRGWHVTGFDFSIEMIKRARVAAELAGVADLVDFVEGDLTIADQIPEGPFELITSIGCLFHITGTEVHRQILKALAARLVPGGKILIDMEAGPKGGWAYEPAMRRIPGADHETPSMDITFDAVSSPALGYQQAKICLQSEDATPRHFNLSSSWMLEDSFVELLHDAGFEVCARHRNWSSEGPELCSVLFEATFQRHDD